MWTFIWVWPHFLRLKHFLNINLASFIVTLPESRIHKNFSNWDLMERKVWKAVLLWARLCPICHSMIRHDNEIGPLLHSCYKSHGGQKCHLLLPFHSNHLTQVWLQGVVLFSSSSLFLAHKLSSNDNFFHSKRGIWWKDNEK